MLDAHVDVLILCFSALYNEDIESPQQLELSDNLGVSIIALWTSKRKI